MVEASRYAVTTHDRCSSPPRSPTIVGSAVETIVWSSDASSRTRSSAAKIRRTRWRRPASVTERRHHRLGLDRPRAVAEARVDAREAMARREQDPDRDSDTGGADDERHVRVPALRHLPGEVRRRRTADEADE